MARSWEKIPDIERKTMFLPFFLNRGVVLRYGDSFHYLYYRSGNEVFSLFSHGLNPRTFTTLLFVSSRHGLPSSILPRVINDTPALLASSDLLIINLSLAALSGLLVGILTTPSSLLDVIIFILFHFCNNIRSIILFYGNHKVLGKRKRSTTKYRPLRQNRYSCAYGATDGPCLEL